MITINERFGEMTDVELVAEIARRRGWTRRRVGEGDDVWMLVDPEGNDVGMWGSVPDFAGDLNVAVELLKEMGADEGAALFWSAGRWRVDCADKRGNRLTVENDNPVRAICLMWLVWEGQNEL
jgi:hypothetical protein